MTMNRRSFMQSILAAAMAPYVQTTAGVLMPVRYFWKPELVIKETIWLPPMSTPDDPLGQRGYLGVTGIFDGKSYGLGWHISINGTPPNLDALHQYAASELKRVVPRYSDLSYLRSYHGYRGTF